ncbi:MAG TPA: hypothetical protein DEA08_30100 [Planctomycetes bacterium]|nr:hypothetical protein [Planctomycetota bacterium]
MTARLILTINDDSTVTLRCDAESFFANAEEIRRLLIGEEEEDESASGEPRSFEEFLAELDPRSKRSRWGRDLSAKGALVLVAGDYLTRERGSVAFTCGDLSTLLAGLPSPAPVQGSQLVYLCRRGWLERVRRGAYRLSPRAVERIESVRKLRQRPAARPKSVPALPSIIGLSRFLRAVPTNKKWRQTLLVAYFLQEHCGTAEFDCHLLSACFKRLRGVPVPGSLSSTISQQLYKRRGLLERGSRRGSYRLKSEALEDLRREPLIAKADALHRGSASPVAKTG